MARSFRFAAFGLALMTIAALCSSAGSAQPPPGGRRPMGFGFGGMGGMGGMAQSPSAMWSMLLRSEKVQKELELVDDQKAKLKEVGEKAMARMREAFSGGGDFRNMSDEQRRARMAEFQKKGQELAEQTKKDIAEVLLPHQVERLDQIALQVLGVQALADKEVQESLGLTEDQKQQMQKAREEVGEKIRAMFAPGAERPENPGERMQSLRKEAEEKVSAVLTAEQKEKFEKKKGPKFDVDPAELFPRGPGRKPGGGPGAKPGGRE